MVIASAAFGAGPVAWVELGAINIEHGLSLLDGADGRNMHAVVEGSSCRVNVDDRGEFTQHFYFDYNPAASRLKRPVYITVEYFDEGFGVFQIQYDSADLTAQMRGVYKEGNAEILLDSRKWRKVTFELVDARFDGRQNMGADFRLLCSGKLAIRKVSVEMEHSANFSSQPQLNQERIRASAGKLTPPAGLQITFSGPEATYSNEAERVFAELRGLAPMMKALGATSVETYVKWDFVEPSPGRWNWKFYDGIVAVLKENGLRWNPFIIIGPAYATPEWFRDSSESVFAVCLEHGINSKIQSIWNPNLSSRVDRFMSEFAERYGSSHVIESIMVGISGDFGEAIYPVTGGGWTDVVPGQYHTHLGYWCGDDYAREDFRKYIENKYGSIAALNAAWETSFIGFEQVAPFIPDDNHSARARLDLIKLYRDRMTAWAGYWLSTVRKYFPCTDLYLCTGGDGQPAHGADFPGQCKIAAKYEAGVRITNESSDYALNFAITRLAVSAARHYGAYYVFEPAGPVSTAGIAARVYNSVTSKTRGIHTYYPTIIAQPGGIAAWSNAYKWLGTKATHRQQIAVLFPQTALSLKWGSFYEKIMELRDAFDFDLVDESMIRDGALKRYKALVILEGRIIEQEDIMRIAEWVRGGGIVISCGYEGFSTVEGDESLFDGIFDTVSSKPHTVKQVGDGLGIYVSVSWDEEKRPVEAIARALSNLSTRIRLNPVPDGVVDGVFVTDIGNRWLIYNSNSRDIEKELRVSAGRRRKVKLPAGSITQYPE